MKAEIKPSKASGTVFVPASKSMAHRALICAGLAKGKSIISNLTYSEDILATMDCLVSLGAKIEINNDTVTIEGTLPGISESKVFCCRESGSTLRFFIPLILLSKEMQTFSGYGRLMQRPMSVYEDICEKQGLTFKRENEKIIVKGMLEGGTFEVPGNISSQFISGMLFALPFCDKDSYIKIIPPIESKSYIDMTVKAMADFGVSVQWLDEATLYIKGNQSYKSRNYTVEGDWSNAAFLDALSIVGGDVDVLGLEENTLQGDSVYRNYFQLIKNEKKPLIDLSDCPDLGPILMALAAHFGGAVFKNTARLKIKESDRGTVMAQELSKFGADIEVYENEIIIKKSQLKAPEGGLCGHNDHRIVMSLSVLMSVYGGMIDGCEAVKKSFPDFFEVLRKLDVEVNLYDD